MPGWAAGRPLYERAQALRAGEVIRRLRTFVKNREVRRELIEALGKGGDPDYLRTVDVWIKRLRAGLKEVGASHALRTVQAKGYVLDLP